MKKSIVTTFFLYIFFLHVLLPGCSSRHVTGATGNAESQAVRMPYEDSVLSMQKFPLLLPYNRLIDPAGTAVRFGDPDLENHSLDAILLPGRQLLLVEDRYGIIIFNMHDRSVVARYSFREDRTYGKLMSSFSGIKYIVHKGNLYIFWGAAATPDAYVMQAKWDGKNISLVQAIPFKPAAPAAVALPNEVAVREENDELYLYVVLNGNDQLAKVRVSDQQAVWTVNTGVAPYGITVVNEHAYVSNWGGPRPPASAKSETAGVPWGSAYIDPRTGATALGTVSVMELSSGKTVREINVGLHPNAIIHSPDGRYVYVANGNSDNISIIQTSTNTVTRSIDVRLYDTASNYIGSTPNALALDSTGHTLYVANGLNNAIAVIGLQDEAGKGSHFIKGFIPTEAYPSGIACSDNMLYVTNLEGIGAWVNSDTLLSKNPDLHLPSGVYTAHKQLASVSFIPLPSEKELQNYTEKVKRLNLSFRETLSRQLPRPGIAPKPLPERIGEPSVFKHVIYIIKENRTYDQVFGDMPQGRGMPSLCVFGDSVTPNQHQLAKDFGLLDNYYASGKSSAEGHQWTDAAMVTDYIEKNVRAWFRSYPHAQYDAMVYDKEGFIWNNALDHGKTVRIYGEACTTQMDKSLNWTTIYQMYLQQRPLPCTNVTTISRVRPILSQSYPGYDDPRINDQLRAEAFISDLKEAENKAGDEWPQLMILSLPNDHTTGTTPGYPTPRAMVADNDLALGKIIEAITKSRFWNSTAVFVTEDDSQSGWDHISAYRTTGFIISPYSRLKRTLHTNYNQTSMVRTIEQILGIPPMNTIDATALPMFDCFTDKPDLSFTYTTIPNRIPLNEMNPVLTQLKGRALHYARLSISNRLDRIDQGDDAITNRILWFTAKKHAPYPGKMAGRDDD